MLTRNRTELALIARGVDSALALQLRTGGWTLQKLQMKDMEFLAGLGIGPEVAAELYGDGRPPIPSDDLAKVLFDNRWVCCICRDAERPIVVHHIEHWAKSRDHSPANLAVLCSLHHGEAHADRGLELSLTAPRIRAAKEIWEREANQRDGLAVQQATQYSERHWWYFNHLRLFALADGAGIDLRELDRFEMTKDAGVCGEDGLLIPRDGPMYGGGRGTILMRYMACVLNAVLAQGIVRNISDEMDRGTINSLVMRDDVVYVQGRYQFVQIAGGDSGTDLMQGTRSVNRVRIRFVFDRNEGTSVSARSLWLTGTQNLGVILQIRQMRRVPNGLDIVATALAIRSADAGLKLRSYESSLHESGLGYPESSYIVEEDEELSDDDRLDDDAFA